MKLIVKSLKGTQFEVEIKLSMKVKDLKVKIFEEDKIEVSTQKLIAVGKVMDDENTLEYYKLKDGDFIVVMIYKQKVKKENKPEATPVLMPQSVTSYTPAYSTLNSGPTADHPSVPFPTGVDSAEGESYEGSEVMSSYEGSEMMSSEELNKTLKEMQNMGFEKDKCIAALKAAFYNPDRAVEFLLNEIPNNTQSESESLPSSVNSDNRAGNAAANTLATLHNNPMFAFIRDRIVGEPEFFKTFLKHLEKTQPQLHQAISANPQTFLSLMHGNEESAGTDGVEEDSGVDDVRADDDEAEDVGADDVRADDDEAEDVEADDVRADDDEAEDVEENGDELISAGAGNAGVGNAGVGNVGAGSAGAGSAGAGNDGAGNDGAGNDGVGSAGVGSTGIGGVGAQDPLDSFLTSNKERDDVDCLIQLGYPKHRAIEAYLACGKMGVCAANYLISNWEVDDHYDKQVFENESEANISNIQLSNLGGNVQIPSDFHGADNTMNVDQSAQDSSSEDAPEETVFNEDSTEEDYPADNPPNNKTKNDEKDDL